MRLRPATDLRWLSCGQEWLEAKLKEQADTPLTQAPKLRMRALAEKYASLEREVKVGFGGTGHCGSAAEACVLPRKDCVFFNNWLRVNSISTKFS